MLTKVNEEIDKVMHQALQLKFNPVKLTDEVRDLLFATVNLSHHLDQMAEIALQQTNRKFERRFR